jgi:hypothetical protein
VDGYGQKRLLKSLRTERLSPNVLVCLYEGEIDEVRIHQKVETLHFGLDVRDDKLVENDDDKLVKNLRGGETVNVVLKEGRVLDIDGLKQAVGASTSAEFALRMIEGVEEVTFLIKPTTV